MKHLGHSVLSSNSNNTPFHLQNLLHVPGIKKNLVSVSKFATDNKAYFEFYVDHCLVKSYDTKETLLSGKIKDGLYTFDNVAIAYSLLASKSEAKPYVFFIFNS